MYQIYHNTDFSSTCDDGISRRLALPTRYGSVIIAEKNTPSVSLVRQYIFRGFRVPRQCVKMAQCPSKIVRKIKAKHRTDAFSHRLLSCALIYSKLRALHVKGWEAGKENRSSSEIKHTKNLF